MTKRSVSMSRIAVCAALAGAACLGVVTTAAAQALEGSFERTLQAQGTVDLSIRSGSGSIRIVPGGTGTVRIVARLRADRSWMASGDVEERLRRIEKNPPIEQQGGTIRIGHFPDDQVARNISISYDVTVPATTKVLAHAGSGSIDIGAVQGPVEAKSGSGSVTVGRVTSAVSASSGSGSVNVEGAASLVATTGSGSIHATAVGGAATLTTGSGTISVSQTGPGDLTARAGSGGITATGVNGGVKLNTGSGSIRVEGRPSAPWSLHCASGGITVALPADAAFDLDARTNSGSIDSDHPVTMTGSVGKKRVQGKVRGGGPLVEISAASGSIRIR